jgi:hypothetical protein
MRAANVCRRDRQVAEQIKTKVLDAGIDGVVINMPTHIRGYQPGVIPALGKAVKAVLEG